MALYKSTILYERGVIKKLAARFNVTDRTVTNAMRFVTEGEQPDLIRATAIKEYGCVLTTRPIIKSNSNT